MPGTASRLRSVVYLILSGVLFFLAGYVAFGYAWQGSFQRSFSTPHGAAFSTPGEEASGPLMAPVGWTVLTVRDVFKDGYSFTAHVPLEEDGSVRTYGNDAQAQALLRQESNLSQRVNHRGEADMTLFIQKTSVPATEHAPAVPANPPLDESVRPGSLLYVHITCALDRRVGTPLSGAPTAEVLALRRNTCLARSGVPTGSEIFTSTGAPRPAPVADVTRYYVSGLGVVTAQPSLTQRLLVILLVALAFLALLSAVTARRSLTGGLRYIMIGRDKRYSNSQFQIVVWFFVLFVALMTTYLFRVGYGGPLLAGWVSVPTALLTLSGLSALTWVGASAITASNTATGAVYKPTGVPRFPHDLFHNDANEFDLGDFQSALVSVLAAASYLVILLGFLSSLSLKGTVLPDVEATILGVFGIGQGAYLVKKYLRVGEQGNYGITILPSVVDLSGGAALPAVAGATLRIDWQAPLQGARLDAKVIGVRSSPTYTHTILENKTLGGPPLTKDYSFTFPLDPAVFTPGQTYKMRVDATVNGREQTAEFDVRV